MTDAAMTDEPDDEPEPGRAWVRWAARGGWVAVAVAVFFHGAFVAARQRDAAVEAIAPSSTSEIAVHWHSPAPKTAASALFAAAAETAAGRAVGLPKYAGRPWASGRAVRMLRFRRRVPPEDARELLTAAAGQRSVTALVTRDAMPAEALDLIATFPNLRRWAISGHDHRWRAPIQNHRWAPIDFDPEPHLNAAAKVPSLRVLDLGAMELTDRHLAALGRLRQVTTVYLSATRGATPPEVRAAMPWATVIDRSYRGTLPYLGNPPEWLPGGPLNCDGS